jgi:hypothetical protein
LKELWAARGRKGLKWGVEGFGDPEPFVDLVGLVRFVVLVGWGEACRARGAVG